MPGRRAPDRSMSGLLAGLRLSGLTWCYADLSGAAGVAVAPGDAVFVHAVIHGTARLACAGGGRTELAAGEAVAVLSGEAHALRTTASAPAAPFDFLRGERDADMPPSFAFGDGSRVGTRVLSGRLSTTWPANVSRAALPATLRLVAAQGEGSAILRADALARAAVGIGAAALLTRLAETLVVAALRSNSRCRAFFTPEASDPVDQALRLIADAPSQPWTVESLARAVGMGRSSFAARFTQRLGKAPMEVVASHRMDHAASLLHHGGFKLAEIAELAGYGSEAAFSRRFTRHFGVTPSQHREAARREKETADPPARSRPLLGCAPAMAAAPPAREAEVAQTAPAEPRSGRRPGILLRS